MGRDVTVIEAKRGLAALNLAEVWRFRELLYFLAWRDVKVKYKQTAIGVVWAVLQPVLAMLVFTFLFGSLAGLPSDGVPYPVFVYAGLLPWNYFASVLGQSTASVVGGANLVTKIYFPRIIMPAAAAAAAFIDLAISSAVLAGMMFWYGVAPGPGLLLVPALAAVTVVNAVGFGIWFSALNVRYRDVQHAIPFLIQIWMFVTPVIYPASLVGGKWRLVMMLNPMGGVIEALRAALFGLPMPWLGLGLSAAAGFTVFMGGLFYFRNVERGFADVI